MRVLGIDPGSRVMGFAVVEKINGPSKMKYIDSGVKKFNLDICFFQRIGQIHPFIESIMSTYRPDYIGIESLIYVKNINSMTKLAQVRGAVISSLMKTHSGKIFEYSPNAIKQAVTGHGHASKENIQKILRMMFGPLKFQTHDESDALAIAVCQALLYRQLNPARALSC